MAVFGKYAEFYDTLYQDKEYKKECDFLEKVFRKYSSRKIQTILDLGCGTASHDILLANKGYRVSGVDKSSEMLKIARRKVGQERLKIDLHRGNIQAIRLRRKFDAVISMFNVMGYQTTDKTFKKVLLTAKNHLKKGGLFIFDCWYGPAVLKNKPKNRTKVAHGEKGIRVIRYSKCGTDVINRLVEVSFTTEKIFRQKLISTNKELHKIRFFFYQELKYIIEKNGFIVLLICPLMELDKEPDDSCWNISVVARHQNRG